MAWRIVRALVALVLLGAFVAFAWPTRWRYDHMTLGSDTYPVRIDRISGHADVLLPGDGWTPAEDVTDPSPGDQENPQENRS